MFYVVMLPVGGNKQRHVAMIAANNYQTVRELLHLPNGWDRYVSLTDLELEAVMQSPDNYKKLFLVTERY